MTTQPQPPLEWPTQEYGQVPIYRTVSFTSQDCMTVQESLPNGYKMVRKWLVADGAPYQGHRRNTNGRSFVRQSDDGEWLDWLQPVKEVWRDLPIVTEDSQ